LSEDEIRALKQNKFKESSKQEENNSYAQAEKVGSQQEEDVLLKGKMKRKKTVPKVFL
jgi:hypothetical protein